MSNIAPKAEYATVNFHGGGSMGLFFLEVLMPSGVERDGDQETASSANVFRARLSEEQMLTLFNHTIIAMRMKQVSVEMAGRPGVTDVDMLMRVQIAQPGAVVASGPPHLAGSKPPAPTPSTAPALNAAPAPARGSAGSGEKRARTGAEA